MNSTPCAAALAELVAVIDAAGLHNLTNGVQLGQTAWYVKASDAIEAARAVLAAADFQTEDQGSRQQRAPDAALIGGVKHLSAAWQPIETAPKDGTVMLANSGGCWIAHWEPIAESGYKFDQPWRSSMLNHWHIPSDQRYMPPTHWMPLPPPPSNLDDPSKAAPERTEEISQSPPKCDDRQQCSPSARYDEVSHGLTSLTLKCRLCGGIRRSDWD